MKQSTHRLVAVAALLLCWGNRGLSQISPSPVLNRLDAADRLAASGEHEAAMDLYEKALRESADDMRARAGEVRSGVAMSLVKKRAGDQEAALGLLLRARRYVPDNPELLYDFGVQAEQMRLYQDADTSLTEAMRLRPNDPSTAYALSRVKLDRDDLPEGERLLRVYLQSRPGDATAHYGLGLAEHRSLSDDEAAAEFRRSIALQPLQTESQYQLGMIALSRADLPEARRWFGSVVNRAPRHGGALTGLGQIDIREKHFPEARAHLQAALQAAPDYAEAHRYLGLVLGKLGDAAGAQAQVEEAARLTEQQNQARKGRTLQQP